METCKCGLGLANTGQEKCPIASVTYGLIGVALEAADGSINKIEAADVLDAAYLTAKLNDPDPTKRWYPIQDLRNLTDVRNDSEFETDSAGNIAELRQGTRPFFAEDWNSTPEFLCQLQSWKCSPFGLFVIDIKSGMVVRSIDDSGDAYPLPVDQNSWAPKLVVAQDANVQKVSISFNWHNELNDCELRYIQATNFETNLKSLRGLFDIVMNLINVVPVDIEFELFKGYGDYRNPIGDVGVLLADVVVNELSPTPGVVPIASVTPDPLIPWRYTLVPTAPFAIGDVVTIEITRPGRDYTAVTAVEITIPGP